MATTIDEILRSIETNLDRADALAGRRRTRWLRVVGAEDSAEDSPDPVEPKLADVVQFPRR